MAENVLDLKTDLEAFDDQAKIILKSVTRMVRLYDEKSAHLERLKNLFIAYQRNEAAAQKGIKGLFGSIFGRKTLEGNKTAVLAEIKRTLLRVQKVLALQLKENALFQVDAGEDSLTLKLTDLQNKIMNNPVIKTSNARIDLALRQLVKDSKNDFKIAADSMKVLGKILIEMQQKIAQLLENPDKIAAINLPFDDERMAVTKIYESAIKLVQEARRLLETTYKRISLLHPEDYAEVQKLILKEIEEGKREYENPQEYLAKQRALRGQIDPRKLIAVHLTKYFPQGGIIKTTSNFKLLFEDYGVERRTPRGTIHFSLNGTVSAHSGGEWSSSKYAILIPLEKIMPKVQVLNPIDTFVFGDLPLPPGTDIICSPGAAAEKLPGVRIIQGSGDLPKDVEKQIRDRGYSKQDVSGWSWGRTDLNEQVVQYGQSKGLETAAHTFTTWSNLETGYARLMDCLYKGLTASLEATKKGVKQNLAILAAKYEQSPNHEERVTFARIKDIMLEALSDVDKLDTVALAK
jgi:hypothetical protein